MKPVPQPAEFRTALTKAMWDAVAKEVKRNHLVLRYWYLKGIADAHQIKEVR